MLAVVGLLGVLALASVDTSNDVPGPMLSAIWKPFMWLFIALEAVAASWVALTVWKLWRWESGGLEGGCVECGGIVRHRNGRYGPYSVCRMCGSKRSGWH